MKKLLPYIFILLIITTFLIKGNVVSADHCNNPGNANTPNLPLDENGNCPDGYDQVADNPPAPAVNQNNPVPLGLATTPTGDSKVYSLLAPIGNLICITTDTSPSKNGTLTDSQKNCTPGGVSAYFNIFFDIIIGLCAVLAIVKIVIAGIQYMGEDSVFGKGEAKSGITSALLGLFIALGAYALLNTINPAFLNSNINIDQASIELEDPITTDIGTPLPPPKQPIAQCGGGVTLTGTFGVCNDILPSFQSMLAAAKADGIILGGGGFRTRDQQIAVRVKYCKGDPLSPSASCSRPVAIPGSSMHESGKAFDFKCNGGGTIPSTTSPCFTWLQKNASNYGFQNLIGGSEPWHWSVNGH